MKKEEKSQLDKFKDAARQLGADDDEARFEKRLKKLVKSEQADATPKQKPRKS